MRLLVRQGKMGNNLLSMPTCAHRDPPQAHPAGRLVVQARGVARRLQAELASLVALIPPEHQTPTRLSRALQAAPSLCHRLLACAGEQAEPLETLRRAPGVEGLRSLLDGFGQRGYNAAVLERCAAAVGEYERLIHSAGGGSHAGLLRTLDEHRGESEAIGSTERRAVKARRNWSQAASQALGLRASASMLTYLMHPGPNPDLFEVLTASTILGVRGRPGHFPVALARGLTEKNQPGRATSIQSHPLEGLVFTQPPFVEHRIGEQVVLIFDVAGKRGVMTRRGRDIVLAHRYLLGLPPLDPAGRRCHTLSMYPRVPCPRLTVDLLLHRALPVGQPQWRGVFFTGGTSVKEAYLERWYSRLECDATVQEVGTQDRPADAPPWYGQLIDRLCARAGRPAAEFRMHRLSVPYPVFGLEHLLTVDFDPVPHPLPHAQSGDQLSSSQP